MNDNNPGNDRLFRRMWAIEQAVMLACAAIRVSDRRAGSREVLGYIEDVAAGLEITVDREVERIPQSDIPSPSKRGLGFGGE